MPGQPTVESLLQANARFYRVFEALDFTAMAELWEASDRVYCVHPGWTALQGRAPVLDSWKRIIENTGSIAFGLSHVAGHIAGLVGVVTNYEHIRSQVQHERHTSTTVSTNLFAFDPGQGRWKLFHHHSSHAVPPPEGDEGLLN